MIQLARVSCLNNSFEEIVQLLKSHTGLGPVKYIFRITEVQGRMTKHIHGVIHLHGAPIYKADGSNAEQLLQFIYFF